MAGQLIELIIFAGVAFVIISKLIAMFGVISEDDPIKDKSASIDIKDVTDVRNNDRATILDFDEMKTGLSRLKNIFVPGSYDNIVKNLPSVIDMMPDLNLEKFLPSSKKAFELLTTAKNTDEIEEFVDKRYLYTFKDMKSRYKEEIDVTKLEAKISDLYSFGNSVFIKVLFSGKGIFLDGNDFHEEWSFTKNANAESPDWYLANIDR